MSNDVGGVTADTPAKRPQAPEPADLLSIIGRAAADPNTDVEKMERLMALYERLTAGKAEAEFNAAMTACQAEMRRVSADATNPQTRSRYASYEQLDRALRPIYTAHGFSLSFSDGETAKPEHIRVVCVVRHAAGHKETYWKDMPADGKGAKGGDVMTKTHAAGAAQSYGMRYLLKGIFNVAIGEDDVDGNEPTTVITEDQAAGVEALLAETGADRAKFCAFMKVARVEDIRAADLPKALRALEAKRGRR